MSKFKPYVFHVGPNAYDSSVFGQALRKGYNNLSHEESVFNSLKDSIETDENKKLLNYKNILKEETHVLNQALNQKVVLGFKECDPEMFGIRSMEDKIFIIDKKFRSFIDDDGAKTLRNCCKRPMVREYDTYNVFEFGNNFYYYIDYYHLSHLGIIFIDSMIIFYAPSNHTSMIDQYTAEEKMVFTHALNGYMVEIDESYDSANPWARDTKSLMQSADTDRIKDESLKSFILNNRIML